MKWRVLLISSLPLWACTPARPCSSNAECSQFGAICFEGVCVSNDGGTGGGGGGTTGGGGGTTGGGGGGVIGGGGGSTGGGGGATGGGGGATGGGGMMGGGGGSVDLCLGANCPVGYSCDATSGECLLRVTSLEVYSPPDGAVTNDAGVLLSARLVTDASVALPNSLSYQVDNGASQTLSLSGNDYSQPLILPDGLHVLRVNADFSDAGFTGSTSVRVDTQGPTITGTLPGAVQQRDEVFTLDLTANEAIQTSSVDVRLNGVQLSAATGTCTANAGCWKVDLSIPVLDALTGAFTVTATATDLAGNTRLSTLGMVNVTRRRWESQPTMTEAIRAAPAIGLDGTIFVGSSNGGNNGGTLYALLPGDGGVRSSAATLGAVQSVATAVSVDAGLVYYTANDTQGRVGARLASDLSLGTLQAAAFGNASSPTYSALALVAKSTVEVGAIASFNSVTAGAVNSRVVVYGSTSAPEAVGTTGNTFDFAAVPNPLDVADNIVINGTEAYLLTRNVGTGMNWQPITGVAGTPVAGTAQAVETGGNDCCLAGQAVVGTGSLIGGTTLARKLYTVSGAPAASGTLGVTAVDNGVPVLASASVAFVGRGSDLVRFNPSMLNSSGVAVKSGSGAIRAAPVLGKARPGQAVGLGYAVNSTGNLFVFAQDGSTNSATDWGAIFVGAPTIYAHPTLDCNRRVGAATATTGILYVASSTGKVAAIVVDSPVLLDTVGAWPKYQRTAGNAGNTDTRFPFNPGCP